MIIIPGRRRPNGTSPFELEPGDYCFRGDRLWMNLPNDSGPRAIDSETWHIRTNPDGAVTVQPSILERIPPDNRPGWHGFLADGNWHVCADSK
jgi:hypothetical protein